MAQGRGRANFDRARSQRAIADALTNRAQDTNRMRNAVFDRAAPVVGPRTAETLGSLMDFVPLVGDASAAEDAYQGFSRGDYIGGGAAALGAILGLVPGVGNAAAAGVKKGIRALRGPADDVADLLRAGRASEVTDDMLARFTPNDHARMAELYESGATGVPMRMDEASRMARAQEMGFSDTPLYHGTGSSFDAFASKPVHRFSEGSGGPQANAAWLTEGQQEAARYAGSELTAETGAGFPNIMGVRARPMNERVVESRYDVPEAIAQGADTVNVRQDLYSELSGEPQHWRVVKDPRNIRSRFARFDPRLSHLSNLTAGGIGILGGATLAELMAQQEQQN